MAEVVFHLFSCISPIQLYFIYSSIFIYDSISSYSENSKLRCEQYLTFQLSLKQGHLYLLLLFAKCYLCVHQTPFQNSKVLTSKTLQYC